MRRKNPTPDWVPLAAVGGGALLAFLFLASRNSSGGSSSASSKTPLPVPPVPPRDPFDSLPPSAPPQPTEPPPIYYPPATPPEPPLPGPPPAPPPQVSGQLTPDTLAAVTRLFEEAHKQLGYTLRIRSSGGYRTCEEQHKIYLIGRTPGDTRAVVTQVDGCRSGHTWGRAVDIDIIGGGSGTGGKGTDSDYRTLGPLGQSLGFDWGGAWKSFYDPGHYGWYPGKTIGEAIRYFCPDPADCQGALARSYAYSVPPPV